MDLLFQIKLHFDHHCSTLIRKGNLLAHLLFFFFFYFLCASEEFIFSYKTQVSIIIKESQSRNSKWTLKEETEAEGME